MTESRRCRAHNRAGQQCGRYAARGQLVCRAHGAASPQAKAAAARRLADAAALEACDKLGVPVQASPSAALVGALHRALGRALYFGAREAGLTERELTFGTTRVVARRDAQGNRVVREAVEESGVNTWTRLRRDEEDRVARIAAEIARLGIEATQVRLSQQQANLMRQVVEGALHDSGLSQSDQQRVLEQIPHHARLVVVPDA
jgi:hypothetical protein